MTSSNQGLLPVFGGASFGLSFNSPDAVEKALQALKDNDCTHIDTAHVYGESEKLLGEVGAGTKWGFNMDSKHPGGLKAGSGTREGVVEHAKQTMDLLKQEQVDIYYLHAPDKTTDLAETLAGIQESYKAGQFKRFGLSNYSAENVQRVYDHCKEHGYVLPTVFQGNYNAVARKVETELLPTLRKLGISFYAYSPMAGGFLTKTKEQITKGGADAGRFDKEHRFGPMYLSLYNQPEMLEALDLWAQAAEGAGIGKAELAYRWVSFNSPLKREHGDAIIIGASKLSQIEGALTWLKKGPVDAETAAKVDKVWELVKSVAPLNNMDKLGLE